MAQKISVQQINMLQEHVVLEDGTLTIVHPMVNQALNAANQPNKFL